MTIENKDSFSEPFVPAAGALALAIVGFVLLSFGAWTEQVAGGFCFAAAGVFARLAWKEAKR